MSSKLIAIAGGTSQLGHAIIQALLAQGEFKPIVLSRSKSRIPQSLQDSAVEVRRVDYLSLESCADALEGVHTVISTLLAKDGTWYRSQKNLLDAGLSKGLKRFVASEFGIGPATTEKIDLFALEQLPVRQALQQAAKDHDDFEWTAFYNGMFMNYLGTGCDKPEAAGLDHNLIFDVKAMTADLPVADDGTVPDVTMTTMDDVGKFVAAACHLPFGAWTEETYLTGQTLNMTDVVKIIERVRGGNMVVKKHTQSSIEAQINAIPADNEAEGHVMTRFFLQLALCFIGGIPRGTVMPPELNEKVPSIKPTQVEKYMRKFW